METVQRLVRVSRSRPLNYHIHQSAAALKTGGKAIQPGWQFAKLEELLQACPQEVCLANKKWVVIDDSMQVRRKLQIAKISQGKVKVQERPTGMHESRSIRLSKSNYKRVSFTEIGSNRLSNEQVGNHSAVKENGVFVREGGRQTHMEKSPSKSIRSCKTNKSIKSSKKNINKTQNSWNHLKNEKQKTNTEPHQEIAKKEVMEEKKEEEPRLVTIGKLYDPWMMWDPRQLQCKMTTNYYEEHPEWLVPLSDIEKVSIVAPSQVNLHRIQSKQEESDMPKVPELALFQSTPPPQHEEKVQDNQNITIPTKVLSSGQQQSPPFVASLQNEQPVDLINKAPCAKIASFGDDNPGDENMLRCLTTKATDAMGQSDLALTLRQFSPKQTKSTRYRDRSFPLINHFSTEVKVKLIHIPADKQTALFPARPAEHLITPTPPQSPLHQLYSNSSIIGLLNLLLVVQPSAIEECLSVDAEGTYTCRLFSGGSMRRMVVDADFPYDSHYYPLFGSVEQYIWLAVLLKGLAKLLGSYNLLRDLSFSELYTLLTGTTLSPLDKNELSHNNPLSSLSHILKTSKSSQHLVLATEGEIFYHIEKISHRKSRSQHKEDAEGCKNRGGGTLTRSGSMKQTQNYRTLTNFLMREKNQIKQRRLLDCSVVHLRGARDRRKMTLRQLMESSIQIWTFMEAPASTQLSILPLSR